MHSPRTMVRLAVAVAALAAAPAAHAQAWNTPSFQTPKITARELNFTIADGGDVGTAFGFQWRQGFAPRTQLSFDVGFADPDGGETVFLLGGQLGYQMTTATRDMPLDMMFTAGFFAGISDPANTQAAVR